MVSLNGSYLSFKTGYLVILESNKVQKMQGYFYELIKRGLCQLEAIPVRPGDTCNQLGVEQRYGPFYRYLG